MKRTTMILLIFAMMASLVTGCRSRKPEDTAGSTEQTQPPTTLPTEDTGKPTESQPDVVGAANTQSAKLLGKIWTQYGTEERFASYGGTVEHAVNDAPGDLDMTNTEELTTKYLLPAEHLGDVEEGASLVHLMNNNIFTAAAFKLRSGVQVQAVAKALRDNVQRNRWICGQPDRLLIAEADGQLLMAFGAGDAMDIFRSKLSQAYADAKMLYDEAITA